jgi:putative Mg2+ transporter-C (MgtC) family protein
MQLSAAEALLRVGLAVLLGMAIGLEREWREKAAGFRTITLVTVGSALFVTITYSGFSPADRARVAAGVVTGIGFLGAGAILRERGQVIGLTTAATVWAACALGIAAGFGAYALAVLGAAIVLVVLIVFPRVDIAELANDVRRYEVVAPYSEERYAAFLARFADAGLRARRKELRREGPDMTVVWEVTGSPKKQRAVIRDLLDDPAVSRVVVV